ncbi:hypothetical protein NDU88_004316 [Pleurodeles waltl]|uniref:Uncharacterized protein n=1 Tax=Pleurodeles waltl TaxID=8319 RepID=A0AAV7VK01_PLEWA|nr:hypothetical protein NDU88_004316 [Pleurodeles waltl]
MKKDGHLSCELRAAAIPGRRRGLSGCRSKHSAWHRSPSDAIEPPIREETPRHREPYGLQHTSVAVAYAGVESRYHSPAVGSLKTRKSNAEGL